MNIGSGKAVRIAWLAERIKMLVGYEGNIHWDVSKPDGQLRRELDIGLARYVLDWQPETSLEDGLKQTIEWYEREIRQPVVT